jgi:hypothetical protein
VQTTRSGIHFNCLFISAWVYHYYVDIVVTDRAPIEGEDFSYTKEEICYSLNGPAFPGYTHFRCNRDIDGQYVVVALSRRSVLTLCEVWVYGREGNNTLSFGSKHRTVEMFTVESTLRQQIHNPMRISK